MFDFNRIGLAHVKCCQNGKILTVKIKNLSKESGTLKEEDLVTGSTLLLECKNKSYPVMFLSLKGMYVACAYVLVF